MPSDSDFDTVSVNSFTDCHCSPDVESDFDFEGIKIATPKRVALEGKPDGFGHFARLIVCGAYRLPANYLKLRENLMPSLVLVAVDQRSHVAYAGRVTGQFDAEPGDSPFDGMVLPDTAFEGRYIMEYFNSNLAQLFPLPEVETDYVVYAVLGSFVSNVSRIALRR